MLKNIQKLEGFKADLCNAGGRAQAIDWRDKNEIIWLAASTDVLFYLEDLLILDVNICQIFYSLFFIVQRTF